MSITSNILAPHEYPINWKADSPIVRLHGIILHFGAKTIFDSLNLSVTEGERLVVMGPSGTGKSTLLKLLVATLPPERGSISILGQEITLLPRRKLNAIRMKMGMVYQDSALISSLSVSDNLALPFEEMTDKPKSEIERITDEKLQFVGLPEAKTLMPAELSGGMRKRVAVARALVLEPKIVFFDEPTAGLDPVATAVIDDLIVNLNVEARVTEIIVTHEMESAFRVATRLAMLYRGRIIEEGKPKEFRRSHNPIVSQFLSGDPHGPLLGNAA